MSSRLLYQQPTPINVPCADATAIARGDLVCRSSGNAIPASSVTWNTDLATTQADFTAAFLGVAASEKVANDGQTTVRVIPAEVVEFDCASASFNVGDLVGPAKQSGNLLENQKVASVAAADKACGRVIEATSSATKVKVAIRGLTAGKPS